MSYSCFSGDLTDSPVDEKPEADVEVTNEISAPYEVPQFPIEQIEKKLQIQRHLNEKWVYYSL